MGNSWLQTKCYGGAEQNPNAGQDAVVKWSKGFIYEGWGAGGLGQQETQEQKWPSRTAGICPSLVHTGPLVHSRALAGPANSIKTPNVPKTHVRQKQSSWTAGNSTIGKNPPHSGYRNQITMPHNKGSQTNTLALTGRHNLLK